MGYSRNFLLFYEDIFNFFHFNNYRKCRIYTYHYFWHFRTLLYYSQTKFQRCFVGYCFVCGIGHCNEYYEYAASLFKRDFVLKDETLRIKDVHGYYMHKQNEFSLLVEEGDTVPVSFIEEEERDD